MFIFVWSNLYPTSLYPLLSRKPVVSLFKSVLLTTSDLDKQINNKKYRTILFNIHMFEKVMPKRLFVCCNERVTPLLICFTKDTLITVKSIEKCDKN